MESRSGNDILCECQSPYFFGRGLTSIRRTLQISERMVLGSPASDMRVIDRLRTMEHPLSCKSSSPRLQFVSVESRARLRKVKSPAFYFLFVIHVRDRWLEYWLMDLRDTANTCAFVTGITRSRDVSSSDGLR